MRFLADENFPVPSIAKLRAMGHDVAAVIEDMPGADDREVLERAIREDRFVVTFDRDFGELIFPRGFTQAVGFFYFRLEPERSDEPADRLLELLEQAALMFEGYFTVVDRGSIRQRALLRP